MARDSDKKPSLDYALALNNEKWCIDCTSLVDDHLQKFDQDDKDISLIALDS